MLLIPAIDLKKGKVVRLYQGKYNQDKLYYQEPLEAIEGLKEKGAKYLHIVDLDAAFGGRPQRDLFRYLANSTDLDFQWAGGIRDMNYLEFILQGGALRAILSTRAISDPDFLEGAVKRFGWRKIAVSLDIRGDEILIEGWEKGLKSSKIHEIIKNFIKRGNRNFILTDVLRNGTLEGARIDFFREMIENFDADFYLAGGVTTYKDLENIKKMGLKNIKGVIVGKAIYEGNIDILKGQQILDS